MIGKSNLLYEPTYSLVRLINLVAFDVVDTSSVHIIDDASPTTKYIHIPLTSYIHKDLHSPIRSMIKSALWTNETSGGKVVISQNRVVVTVYLKRLRKPAWSPPKPDKAEET